MQAGSAVRMIAVAAIVVGGIYAGARLLGASEAQAASLPAPVVVEARSVGIADADVTTRVVIYTSGDVMYGAGRAPRALLQDTLRLEQFRAFTAEVTHGDLHIAVEGPGTLTLAATVSNGPAERVGARGRHIVVFRGGTGIESLR